MCSAGRPHPPHRKKCRGKIDIHVHTSLFRRIPASVLQYVGSYHRGAYGERARSGGVSAVDGQAGAGDEAGFGTGEAGSQGSDLVPRQEAIRPKGGAW
jgi:hypothetical protein